MARETGLEPATSGVTGRRSNQLSYSRSGRTTCLRNVWWMYPDPLVVSSGDVGPRLKKIRLAVGNLAGQFGGARQMATIAPATGFPSGRILGFEKPMTEICHGFPCFRALGRKAPTRTAKRVTRRYDEYFPCSPLPVPAPTRLIFDDYRHRRART